MNKPIQHTRNTQIISNSAPFAFVEAYKSFRTNLQFASINNHYKKIIVTSSLPGEGKSTVAINLALSLADNGNQVLLVDTDLRKPVIKKYLHLKGIKDSGITNVLTEKQTFLESVILLSNSGLNVLASGPIPPNPVEILGSRKMLDLIHSFEDNYDYIIFDTPPVTVVTDAAVLSKYCDGVILVVKQRYTDREVVMMAKKNLESVNANIIGCVLNDFNVSKTKRPYEYYRYQKYEKYGYSTQK